MKLYYTTNELTQKLQLTHRELLERPYVFIDSLSPLDEFKPVTADYKAELNKESFTRIRSEYRQIEIRKDNKTIYLWILSHNIKQVLDMLGVENGY